MDWLYSLLKITSMLATGSFGALGLLTRHKDDRGKLTRWGKVALGGILISSGISLGLYVLETSRAKAAAIRAEADARATAQKLETILVNAQTTAEQQKRSLEETNILKGDLKKSLERSEFIAQGMEDSLTTQQSLLAGNKRILGGVTNTVSEVNRGLYPIKEVRISFSINVPTDHAQLRSYINRFEKELRSLLPKLDSDSPPPGISTRVITIGNITGPESYSRWIVLWPDTSLVPEPNNEMLADILFRFSSVRLLFFKQTVNPARLWQISGDDSDFEPDLALSVHAWFSPPKKGEPAEQNIVYSEQTGAFSLDARDLPSDSKYWSGTGKIVGIPDLLGAQMVVVLGGQISGAPVIDSYLREIRQGFELESLHLSLSTGIDVSFEGASMRKYVTKHGMPAYSFVFPKTLAELRKVGQ